MQDLTRTLSNTTGVPEAFFADWGHGWHRDPAQMGGGAFADIGSHTVDRILWLAGAPAVEIVAFTESTGLPVECFVNVQARLANGVLLSLTSADAVPQGVLHGSQHMMIVGDQGILSRDPDGSLWIYGEETRRKVEIGYPDTTAAAAFVSAIVDGIWNLKPAREAAQAVEFIEATYRSAAEGRIIQIGTK